MVDLERTLYLTTDMSMYVYVNYQGVEVADIIFVYIRILRHLMVLMLDGQCVCVCVSVVRTYVYVCVW